jgi:8-oxo-dGTP pyrophosphatase MutT (NUDIX family)
MDDLVERTRKYARSAGRTGLGHYKAAAQSQRWDQWLGGASVVLSAVVGTSIFADWATQHPLPFGLAALLAAGFSAVQGTSKFAEQAAAHRIAGAEYGRLRRHADMLRLRFEAGDLARQEGLAELDRMGEALSDLAKKSRALPDQKYYAAVKNFDQDHPEYLPGSSTHAGGVVIRRVDGVIQYLIVNAKGKRDEWVLPKGHIEAAESAEQAARREVREETGIEALVRAELDSIEFPAPSGRVQGLFFLMEAVSQGQAREDRNVRWCSYEEAIRSLTFKEARRLVCQAHTSLLDASSAEAPGSLKT